MVNTGPLFLFIGLPWSLNTWGKSPLFSPAFFLQSWQFLLLAPETFLTLAVPHLVTALCLSSHLECGLLSGKCHTFPFVSTGPASVNEGVEKQTNTRNSLISKRYHAIVNNILVNNVRAFPNWVSQVMNTFLCLCNWFKVLTYYAYYTCLSSTADNGQILTSTMCGYEKFLDHTEVHIDIPYLKCLELF